MAEPSKDRDDDRSDVYEAQDGTIFDTRYRGAESVYVAEDGTVVVKPKSDDD